jgi:4-hydroxy-tetrahydrodipicolinate synthase
MTNGFYTALGTPLTIDGSIEVNSLTAHIDNQISHGAAGLLLMGSMGAQAGIKGSEFTKAAKVASQAVRGACPLFVGVMDNSVARVKDRIDSIQGLAIDGVVATAPYYFPTSQPDLKQFFRALAEASPFPLYLYDLPGVTQSKIQTDTVLELMAHPNIVGIKTADLAMSRVIMQRRQNIQPGFQVVFSGLDIFDAAYAYGIGQNLDGMFSCTPSTASKLYKSLANGDAAAAANHLNQIVGLRDLFGEVGIFPGFTHAMNLLGFEGSFHPDYMTALQEPQKEKVKQFLKDINEIA